MIKQIRDLETELENERRGKSASVNAKKKVEAQIAELEQQLEVSNRLKVRRKTSFGIPNTSSVTNGNRSVLIIEKKKLIGTDWFFS